MIILSTECSVFMGPGFMQPNEDDSGDFGLAVLDSMGVVLPLPIILMCSICGALAECKRNYLEHHRFFVRMCGMLNCMHIRVTDISSVETCGMTVVS